MPEIGKRLSDYLEKIKSIIWHNLFSFCIIAAPEGSYRLLVDIHL